MNANRQTNICSKRREKYVIDAKLNNYRSPRFSSTTAVIHLKTADSSMSCHPSSFRATNLASKRSEASDEDNRFTGIGVGDVDGVPFGGVFWALLL